MMSIRDEISKVIDIRIPPNGYRRYIKEVARTGGFQDMQRDDCIIALALCVEELQKHVDELLQRADPKPFNSPPPTEDLLGHLEAPKASEEKPEFECVTCGISFKQRIGLEGHKRGKGHKDAITKSA